MNDDYGFVPTDIEVGVHALRTFDVRNDKLTSVIQGDGHWDNGVCVARCILNHEHEAPVEKCTCGIYAFFGVQELLSQYPDFACRIIAVIAAEGMTTIGTRGLKTAAARVVAYWCTDDDQPVNIGLATVCANSCPGARRFYDRDVMTRVYGINGEPPGERNADG